MTNPVVSQYLNLLDSAFDASRWHSVVGNLNSVSPEAWTWIPPGGDRSIQYIVEHLGLCKIMYENHAFGDGNLRWDDRLIEDESVLATIPSAVEWLRSCNDRCRRSVAALNDADLLRLRKTNWGEAMETRWIISVMLEHDLYHAGEINFIRFLHNPEASRYEDDHLRSVHLAKMARNDAVRP
jgi:hypothetical protein